MDFFWINISLSIPNVFVATTHFFQAIKLVIFFGVENFYLYECSYRTRDAKPVSSLASGSHIVFEEETRAGHFLSSKYCIKAEFSDCRRVCTSL